MCDGDSDVGDNDLRNFVFGVNSLSVTNLVTVSLLQWKSILRFLTVTQILAQVWILNEPIQDYGIVLIVTIIGTCVVEAIKSDRPGWILNPESTTLVLPIDGVKIKDKKWCVMCESM